MPALYFKSSGNIISEDFCRFLASDTRSAYIKDSSFEIRKTDDHIATVFDLLRERWEELRIQLLNKEFDTSRLRDKWLRPFFELLDFDPAFRKSHLKNDIGTGFHLTHQGWDDPAAPVIHMVNPRQELDFKDDSSHTHPLKSPHETLQQYLNTTSHRWGILTNGLKIRLLRDFYHSITKGYIEFDLESIFESASYDDFKTLFRLLHKSRFIGQYRQGDESENTACILEEIYKKSQDTGVQIGNRLRDQVKAAIETLGNGFIEQIPWKETGQAEVRNLYEEIMNLIYRMLFLMFAEQKGWLPVINEYYARTYSLNALRLKAERNDNPEDSFTDLWEGLKITFRLVAGGYTFPNGDTIHAFGGQLFSARKISAIENLPLKNKFLLNAVYNLSFFENDKLRHKINYTTLAIDALGSVYESLLDYEPALAREQIELKNRTLHPGEFYLDDRSSERKTTGSYYTDHRLVSQLISSALIPVIEEALHGKVTRQEREEALLDLKVCDMACGSGAFLIAALEKLGEYLAHVIRGDDEPPTEDELRQARHKVLLNCIYGVDLNPMAIDLAKFSLWITASMPRMPLSFLDHKLRCGNSLIGADEKLVSKGIPPEAFNPHSSDIKEICVQLKKRARQGLDSRNGLNEPAGMYAMGLDFTGETDLVANRYKILDNEQESPDQVEAAEAEYIRLTREERHYRDFLLADCYTAAFFIPRDDHDLENYVNNRTLQLIREHQPVPQKVLDKVEKARQDYRFFHWSLEFPEVFNRQNGKGGFDCILGNPPWERVKLVEKEFFANVAVVANAPTAAKRSAAIASLENTHPLIFKDYLAASHKAEATSNFLRNSGRFPLLGVGDVNTYTVFTENCRDLTGHRGRLGIIIPTGIATDDTTKDFFRNLVETRTLVSLFDFENREGLFPDVDSRFRFCLLTVSGKGHEKPFDFLFYATNTFHLEEEHRHFSLDKDELLMINPNTGNCPVFRNRRDAEIVKKIYRKFPVLLNEKTGENPWGIKYYTMFHMANDSALFRTKAELEAEGFSLKGNLFKKDHETYLPLYEAKMVWHYDHRYGTYEGFDFDEDGSTSLKSPTPVQYRDPDYEPLPRYWVNEKDMPMQTRGLKWLLGFRDITNATNERTLVSTIIPVVGVGHTFPLIFTTLENHAGILIGCFNSIVFDFITRQKTPSTHLTYFVIKQLPTPDITTIPFKIKEIINELVENLVITSTSVAGFSLSEKAIIHEWDEESRFRMKCRLDAIYAYLYELTREELDYIIETFPIVKRKDLEKYGCYRTKETILKHFDERVWEGFPLARE